MSELPNYWKTKKMNKAFRASMNFVNSVSPEKQEFLKNALRFEYNSLTINTDDLNKSKSILGPKEYNKLTNLLKYHA